jgi:translation initiation factor 2 subunit 3
MNPKLIPEVNIGMVGHVSHGKTALTEALTGRSTLTHSEELKRGITIRLGYSDATFYKCPNGHYVSTGKCPICFSDCAALRTVSFIDAPGHETLMATVLTGAALMDGAILLIAANEKCPQPQTREHLTALELVGIKNVIIAQNKIDLLSRERIKESYNEIKNFVAGTELENVPIIPVSAQQRVNIDMLIEAMENFIPTPERDVTKDPRMFVARSFDINKPGTPPEKLVGGVFGGSIIQGKLKVGDEIEIRPGIKFGEKHKPITSRIAGLQKAGMNMEEAGPGGLLGLLTTLDPFLTKSDALVGNLVGLPGKLSDALTSLNLTINLLERVVGSEELGAVTPIKVGEDLMINVGTARSVGTVTSAKKDRIELKLKIPVCVEEKERIVIFRQIARRWRLIGYGIYGQ